MSGFSACMLVTAHGMAAHIQVHSICQQGRAPLPYALSELVDNALRATQSNAGGRHITITLVTSGGASPSAGLISVWDNGARRCCWLLDCHWTPGCLHLRHKGCMQP